MISTLIVLLREESETQLDVTAGLNCCHLLKGSCLSHQQQHDTSTINPPYPTDEES
jgi:hypothetical protein